MEGKDSNDESNLNRERKGVLIWNRRADSKGGKDVTLFDL